MSSVLVSIVLLAAACAGDGSNEAAEPTATPTAEPTSPPSPTVAVPSQLEEILEDVEDTGFEGVVAIDDGANRVVRAFGTADRSSGTPNAADTVFDIGSLTKQFTGAAILRLQMDGSISVDDPIGQYVDGLTDAQAAITLHELLTHTGGLPDAVGDDYDPVGLDGFVELVAQAELRAAPGSVHRYSNVGYSLLAAAIERVTGTTYEEYLETALFEPAGMLDTGYVLPQWPLERIAVGYGARDGDRFGRPNAQRWDGTGPYWNLRGNGGILSTAGDMLRWHDALAGDTVLDAEAKELFYTPHVEEGPGAGTHYGYGWAIFPAPDDGRLITHNGGNGYFFADFLRFIDHDLTVFIATNRARSEDDDLAFRLAGELLGVDLLGDLGASDDCGFGDPSIERLPEGTEVDALPGSVQGEATAELLAVLADGDEDDRLMFAEDHVSPLLADVPAEVIADEIVALQEEFAGYAVERIIEQDPTRLHLVMEGPDIPLLISLGFAPDAPERLVCVSISD